jgi:uncharacterized protein YuzE
MRLTRTARTVAETRKVAPGALLDIDASDQVVAIEVPRMRARTAA